MFLNNVEYDTILAVDPGANGAITHFRDGLVKSVDMPKDQKRITDYFKYITSISVRVLAGVERVSLWVGDLNMKSFVTEQEDKDEIIKEMLEKSRVQSAKVFRLQKLIENFNRIKFNFENEGYDHLEIYPVSWQGYLGLINKGEEETETQKKNRHKQFAQSTFKAIQVTHKNADALNILAFMMYKIKNDPGWYFTKQRLIYGTPVMNIKLNNISNVS